jgi:uncharacterized protein YutD
MGAQWSFKLFVNRKIEILLMVTETCNPTTYRQRHSKIYSKYKQIQDSHGFNRSHAINGDPHTSNAV